MDSIQDPSLKASIFLKDLKDRGIVCKITNENRLKDFLSYNGSGEEKKKIYLGIDPTAASLHLGNYFALTILKRFLDKGYDCVLLFGHATALIGDPSFRDRDRPVLEFEEINDNVHDLFKEIKSIFENYSVEWWSKSEEEKKFLNELFPINDNTKTLDFNNKRTLNNKEKGKLFLTTNYFFYKESKEFSFLTFVSTVCSKMKVNDFLRKKFLKNKLEAGLKVSEFLYPILQSFDFSKLYSGLNVCIQIGGSDQWGNIVSGVNLIENEGGEAVGFTFPLLTDSKGKKFGKSDGNAFFLNPTLTKPIDLYQYLMRLEDDVAFNYLKMMHSGDLKALKNEYETHKENRSVRHLQKLLASFICRDIYDDEVAGDLAKKSDFIYSLSPCDISNLESNKVKVSDFIWELKGDCYLIVPLLCKLNLSKSNSEAGRLIREGAIKVNGVKINSLTHLVKKPNNSCWLLIQRGKKERRLIKFVIDSPKAISN